MTRQTSAPQLRMGPMLGDPIPSAALESWIVHGTVKGEHTNHHVYLGLYFLRSPSADRPTGAILLTQSLNEASDDCPYQVRLTGPAMDRLTELAAPALLGGLPWIGRVAQRRFRRNSMALMARLETVSLLDKGPRLQTSPFVMSWDGVMMGIDAENDMFRMTMPMGAERGFEANVKLPTGVLDEGAERLWPGSAAGAFEQVAPALPMTGRIGREDVEGSLWVERRWGAVDGWYLTGAGRRRNLAGWDRVAITISPKWQVLLDRRVDPETETVLGDGAVLFEDGRPIALDGGFDLRPTRFWDSPETGARYAVAWSLSLPALGLSGEITAHHDAQELPLPGGLSLWQGSASLSGRIEAETLDALVRVEQFGPGTAQGTGGLFRRRMVSDI